MSHVRLRKDVSSAETCGFVTYMLSFPIAAAYLLWAYVPDEILHSVGITYYPPKSVAVQLPTYILSLFAVIPLLYFGLNILSTPRYDSLDTLWDGHSKVATVTSMKAAPSVSPENRSEDESAVPEICDIDVGVINKMLLRSMTTGTENS